MSPTYYVPAYDTEAIYPWWELGNVEYTPDLYAKAVSYEGERLKECLDGIRAVADVHRAKKSPATFFVVAKLAQHARKQLRDILDDPLFEIGCHSYSHADVVSIQSDDAALKREVVDAKKILEDIFQKPVSGFTTPGAYSGGLREHPKVQSALTTAGFEYVRSWGKGSLGALPAPLTQPFFYQSDNQTLLLELSLHAWHDNVLGGQPFTLVWPRELPWEYPDSPAETAEDVFNAYKPGIDFVKTNGLLTYVPCLHPWSIYRIDRRASQIAMLLEYARDQVQVARCDTVAAFARNHAEELMDSP